jgi:hypothetical protein
MTRPTPLDLARTAYEAYGDDTDWINHAGNAMPSWAELGDRIQHAWGAAAGAVERALNTPPERRGA